MLIRTNQLEVTCVLMIMQFLVSQRKNYCEYMKKIFENVLISEKKCLFQIKKFVTKFKSKSENVCI